MLTHLLRLWICSCIAVFIALGCSYLECASAQTRHEPRLEGISYSELADWQRWYGGGPGVYGYAPGHVPFFYNYPVEPPMFMEPCPPRKAKRGKVMKKTPRN